MKPAPDVPPYQSCIACFKGDTGTAVYVKGVAEFHIAALHKAAGISLDEASATFRNYAEQELGCRPGMVPAGRFDVGYRLCRVCAKKTDTVVTELPAGDAVIGYVQP